MGWIDGPLTIGGGTNLPYRLDEVAVRDAIDHYGLEFPVRIQFMAGRYVRGTHRVNKMGDGRKFHLITLSRNVGADRAGRTLWHELTHANQAETDPSFSSNYAVQSIASGYTVNRYEREARESEALNEVIRLAN